MCASPWPRSSNPATPTHCSTCQLGRCLARSRRRGPPWFAWTGISHGESVFATGHGRQLKIATRARAGVWTMTAVCGDNGVPSDGPLTCSTEHCWQTDVDCYNAMRCAPTSKSGHRRARTEGGHGALHFVEMGRNGQNVSRNSGSDSAETVSRRDDRPRRSPGTEGPDHQLELVLRAGSVKTGNSAHCQRSGFMQPVQ